MPLLLEVTAPRKCSISELLPARPQSSQLRRAGSAWGARHPLGHFRRLPGAGAAHKRALYLNLTVFVSPLHMNIYREEGPASTPAAPFTESINNSFVKPDLGTED